MNRLTFWNNGETTLAGSISDSATSITLTDKVALFGSTVDDHPEASMLATITHPSTTDIEIVRILGTSDGTNYKIKRYLDGLDQTTALAWPSGSKISARVTAGMLNAFSQSPRLQHFPAIVRDENLVGSLAPGNSTTPVVIYTHSVDLGTPPSWAASTTYAHGDIVIPTTPNGHQYRMCSSSGFPDSGTSSGTEPTWGSDTEIADGTARWLRSTLTTGTGVRFRLASGEAYAPAVFMFVDEVGFISRTVTASGAPSVSIGSSASATLFANATSLTEITAAKRIHRIASTVSSSVDEIRFLLTTAATGGRCVGQFYAKGIVVQDGLTA